MLQKYGEISNMHHCLRGWTPLDEARRNFRRFFHWIGSYFMHFRHL